MKFTYWALGLLLGCLLLLTVWPTGEAHAHFCDDNYAVQQDRENCWWRYWNDLTTDADRGQLTAQSSPLSDGTLCDSHFTTQQEREDCWWRYWNDRPLVPIELSVELIPDSETPLTAAAQTSQQTSHQTLIGDLMSPINDFMSTLPWIGGDIEQLGQRYLCGGKRHPGEAGVSYGCNRRTGEWVKVRTALPGIHWTPDCDLLPPSEGNCAEGFTHYDPIKRACIRQSDTQTCP